MYIQSLQPIILLTTWEFERIQGSEVQMILFFTPFNNFKP